MMDTPIDRRQALAVAAGMACSRTFQVSAAEGLQPVTFAIVSDTHLGRRDNLSAEKNWRLAIDELNQQSFEFVLHLGDVVDLGRPQQYPLYVETRKLLKKPIHEIPGNHDPIDLFCRHIADASDRSVDYGSVRFVLFNNAHRDSHDGFITDEQNLWLKGQCEESLAKKLKIVICCHVPVHSNKHPDRGWYVKPADGQTDFYETLRCHSGQILACLHGHFHNGIRGWRDHGQTVEVLCPSVCYNQDRNLKTHLAAGAADGFFVDELRPGYVLAKLGAGRLHLQYKPLDAKSNGEYTATWS